MNDKALAANQKIQNFIVHWHGL